MLFDHNSGSESREDDVYNSQDSQNEEYKEDRPHFHTGVFMLITMHVLAPFIIFYGILPHMTVTNMLWFFFSALLGALGTTAGAHRLWTHRSYKAKLPLQILLVICYASSGQTPIFNWVRIHRMHHKYSDTDADPHNAKRGFFFSHVGWLLTRQHPQVYHRKKEIDISDILNDPILSFHDKNFLPLMLLFTYILPTMIPVYFWQESWTSSIALALIRHIIIVNVTFSVNSFAHIWGQRPYDKRIMPRDNAAIAIATIGEGWHNYHHCFPWDYKASEFGSWHSNPTTAVLNLFAKIGWVYDLKSPTDELVKTYIQKYGDGSLLLEVPEEHAKK